MNNNILLDKGIILTSGEISKDKINLVAGAITQPFAEMVWITTGGDMETINRLTDILVSMNTPADRGKLFKIIKMLYGLMGLPFSEEAEPNGSRPCRAGILHFLLYGRFWGDYQRLYRRNRIAANERRFFNPTIGEKERRFFMPSCYAVGAEKALTQAALRARFSRGKGFIPKPSKSLFYCVTNPQQRSDEAMAVFRVEKSRGYTVMSNHHLRNKELSLKAKGLLSQMLSLPEDWDYYEAPEAEKNFTTLLEMINASEAREDDPEFQSPVDLMFERLEEKDPEHFAVRQYKKFLLSAGKTRSSILISCGARLAPFDICSKPLLENIGHESAELSASTVKEKILLWNIRRKTARSERYCFTIMGSAGTLK